MKPAVGTCTVNSEIFARIIFTKLRICEMAKSLCRLVM